MFTGAQRNRTTYKKDAYVIVQTFDSMGCLFWGARPVHIFIDHRNLLFAFTPTASRLNSPRRVLSKVYRWAIHLSRFKFFIDHIEVSKNVIPDILARWGKGSRKTSAKIVAALYSDVVPTSKETNIVTIEKIVGEQKNTKHLPK